MRQQRRVIVYLWSVAAGLAVGIIPPLLLVWHACLRPVSEGCVWGHALLPVNIGGWMLIAGVPTFLTIRYLLRRR